MRLGRVAGIPLGINWTVAVILALIAWLLGASVLPSASPANSAWVYWAVAVAAAVVFLASLLVHELAHALVARRYRVPVGSITLWMLGGMTELGGEPPSARADLRIALAGPVVSLAEGGLLAGVAVAVEAGGGPGVVVAGVGWLALMNGLLGVFNLLPGAPLDGGRVLRAVLWRRYHDQTRASLTAARAGRFVGYGLAIAGFAEMLYWSTVGGVWLILVGLFLASTAGAEQRATLAGSALAGVRVADVMVEPDVAPGWRTVQDFIEEVAARSRQSAFPVRSFGGDLAGVIVGEALTRIPPAQRATRRVDQVALRVPEKYQAAPEDPVGPLLGRPPLGGEVVAIVIDEGRIVGIVCADDLRRAMLRGRLSLLARRGRAVAPALDRR